MHIHNLRDNTALSINARKTIFGRRKKNHRAQNRPRFVGRRANLRASKMHSAGNIAATEKPRRSISPGMLEKVTRRHADFRALSSLLCHCLCRPTAQLQGRSSGASPSDVTILSGSFWLSCSAAILAYIFKEPLRFLLRWNKEQTRARYPPTRTCASPLVKSVCFAAFLDRPRLGARDTLGIRRDKG